MLILKMLKIEMCHSTWDDFMLATRFWRTWESIKCPGQWPGTTGRWGLSHWHGVTYLQHFFFAIFWRQEQVNIKGTGEAPEDQHLSWEHSASKQHNYTVCDIMESTQSRLYGCVGPPPWQSTAPTTRTETHNYSVIWVLQVVLVQTYTTTSTGLWEIRCYS